MHTSVKRQLFCFVAASILFGGSRPSVAGQLTGYTFYGPNAFVNAPPGAIAGGYFFFDPNALPNAKGFVPPSGYYVEYAGYRDKFAAAGSAAIDDVLSNDPNNPAPVSMRNEYSQFLTFDGDPNATGSGFLRYDSSFTDGFINIYTGSGPMPTTSNTLLSAIESAGGIRQILGGIALPQRAVTLLPPTLTVNPITKSDIVMKSPTIEVTKNGTAIEATIAMTIKVAGYEITVNPKDVARYLGFDHFAWLQTMSGPSNWQYSKYEDPRVNSTYTAIVGGRLVEAKSSPIYDPVVGNARSAYVVRIAGLDESSPPMYVPLFNPESPDEYEFYDAEVNAPISSDRFYDRPAVPDFLFAPGYSTGQGAYQRFHTTLVGVDSNHKLVDLKQFFPDVSLGFSWASNAVYHADPKNITGGSILIYARNSEQFAGMPPIVSGGIFDIEFDSPNSVTGTPEPATFSIWLALCIMAAAYRGRSTKKAK